MIEQYTNHPAADLFPMMQGIQWEQFKEDVRQNGFQESVTLYKNQILDGRNRYKVAIELNMLDDLPISEIDDDTNFDPYQWVISRNLHRRHLNESQRAGIAAKLAKLKHGDVASQKHDGQICPSIQQAAEMLQVSPTSVKNAKVVLEHGSPELIQAVEQGKVAVSKAAAVAKGVPKEKQLEVAKTKSQNNVPQKPNTKPELKLKNREPERDLDLEAVQAFLTCRSRLSRIKKLLVELTEAEIQVVSDWIKNLSK